MAWPYRDNEWTDLAEAQRELRELIAAIARTEPVRLLVHPSVTEPPTTEAEQLCFEYGDAWTRDTAPIVALSRSGARVPLTFEFNGWGGKYFMPGDEDLGRRLASRLGEGVHHNFVLEGGAVEVDGAGTALTTRNCLLNPNRHPPSNMEERLKQALSIERVIWTNAQLLNDHTDGHIDTLARFVAPGEVVCMKPSPGDPNEPTLSALIRQMNEAGMVVHLVPSPGKVLGLLGDILPASYLNYYLANGQVLVPLYGTAPDNDAVAAIGDLFPKRKAEGLPARAILEGGGAFHCVTQQVPLPVTQ